MTPNFSCSYHYFHTGLGKVVVEDEDADFHNHNKDKVMDNRLIDKEKLNFWLLMWWGIVWKEIDTFIPIFFVLIKKNSGSHYLWKF